MPQLTLGTFQVFDDLPDERYQALKASIAKDGVLVAVEIDQNGHVLDGHHRIKAWEELKAEGVAVADYPRMIRTFDNDDDREEHAAKLNAHRRDVSTENKKRNALRWRQRGWTYRRIADALAVNASTVLRWIPESGSGVAGATPEQPTRVTGADGKSYAATKPKPPVIATSARQQERVLTAMDTFADDDQFIDTKSGEILTADDITREARRRKEEQARERQPVLITDQETERVLQAMVGNMAPNLIPLEMSQDALRVSGQMLGATSKLYKLPLEFRQQAIEANPSMRLEYEKLLASAAKLTGAVREMLGVQQHAIRRIS